MMHVHGLVLAFRILLVVQYLGFHIGKIALKFEGKNYASHVVAYPFLHNQRQVALGIVC